MCDLANLYFRNIFFILYCIYCYLHGGLSLQFILNMTFNLTQQSSSRVILEQLSSAWLGHCLAVRLVVFANGPTAEHDAALTTMAQTHREVERERERERERRLRGHLSGLSTATPPAHRHLTKHMRRVCVCVCVCVDT